MKEQEKEQEQEQEQEQAQAQEQEQEQDRVIDAITAEPIIQLMANIINYLNVSLYEGQFMYKHEQARARINTIYDAVSATPTISPSLSDCEEFYCSVNDLGSVTDTDDPEYHVYKKKLREHLRGLQKAQLTQ